MADEVWQTVDRPRFADSSGRRHGPPRIGSWWDFTRIPGRARSHTKATPTWETYRLVGTLDGPLGASWHPGLPASVSNTAAAAARPAGSSILAQPARLPAPPRPASGWWADHNGVLAVVFTGLAAGGLVMAVRVAPRGGSVGAPGPFPRRPGHLAQDRHGAGAGPPRAGRLAVLRALTGASGRIPVAEHPSPPGADPRRSAGRYRCERVQPCGGVLPRRRSRAAGRRPGWLHPRPAASRRESRALGPGPPA